MPRVFVWMPTVSDLLRVERAGLRHAGSARYLALARPMDRRRYLARRMAISAVRRRLGMPEIVLPEQGAPPSGCSVSSSGDAILVAQSDDPSVPVGIDLEVSERWPDAATVLGGKPGEAAQAWVRLEAMAKATGVGVEEVLRCCRSGIPCEGGALSIRDLRVPDAKAALATWPDAEVVWMR